jgi:branched-chain amino acid transport system ATP-binding protein
VVSSLTISDRGYVVQNGAVLLADTAKSLLTNDMVRAAYLGL